MWKELSIYTYNLAQWEELPNRSGDLGKKRKSLAGVFFLQIMAGVANIVRFKKTAPRDQISIPYWALSLSRVSYSLRKRQVQTFLIVHTSSI